MIKMLSLALIVGVASATPADILLQELAQIPDKQPVDGTICTEYYQNPDYGCFEKNKKPCMIRNPSGCTLNDVKTTTAFVKSESAIDTNTTINSWNLPDDVVIAINGALDASAGVTIEAFHVKVSNDANVGVYVGSVQPIPDSSAMFIIIAGSTVDGTLVPLSHDYPKKCLFVQSLCPSCYSEDIPLTPEQIDIITNTLISQAISDLKKKIVEINSICYSHADNAVLQPPTGYKTTLRGSKYE